MFLFSEWHEDPGPYIERAIENNHSNKLVLLVALSGGLFPLTAVHEAFAALDNIELVEGGKVLS